MKILALVLTVLIAGCNLAIAQSPYATRLPAELQTAQMDSLADVTWLQGTTPAIRVEPLLRGRPVAVDADTTVRMVIGPSATGTLYAARTNLAAVTNAYEIQWPTIGTNSSGQAWFYTLLFDREGKTYWSGSGALYIDASGYTGQDGVEWIEYTTPNTTWQNILGDDPSANAALKAYIDSQLGSGEPLWIAASNSVVSGIASNSTDIAIMETGKLDVAAAATTYQPIGDYALTAALAGYVPTNRTITINGVAQDLSSDRAWTVECGSGGSGISAAEAGQIATNVLSTATTNSMPLIDFGSGGGWTNLTITGTGNAITNATAAGDTLTLERGTIEGGGGGGTADPFSSILVEADWTWTNGIYAVGANTSVTNIAITLPDAGTNFASVVVRKFSNLNQLLVVRGTNVVYTLYDDGSTRSYDWWPQYTNWYWRN